MSFTMPIVVIAFVALSMIYALIQRRAQGNAYAHFRAGSMAGRLGLTLVNGDPMFNLLVPQANAGAWQPNGSNHVELSMRGAPHGPPLEFRYLDREEKDAGLFETSTSNWFECRLTVYTAQAFPPFEVVSRQAPQGPIIARMAIPAMTTGNPQIDRDYHVSTIEPAMAQLLGTVLPSFAMFQGSGIHLVGDGNSISFFMERHRAPILANALYQPEQLSALLSDLAKRIGG